MVSRKTKQVITFTMAMIMIFGVFATAVFAESPKPISVKSEDESPETVKVKTESERIQELRDKGYIEGYDDGSLGEDRHITRAEFTTIATRALGLEQLATTLQTVPTGFTDVSTTSWYNGYIGVARTKNLVEGHSPTIFGPEDNVKHEEAIAIMARMILTLEEKNAVEKGAKWPINYFVKATEMGLLNNVEGVTIGTEATRATVFLILSNVINILEEKNTTLADVLVTENNEEVLEFVVLKDSGQFKEKDTLKIKNNKETMEKLSVGSVYTIGITDEKKITSLKVSKDAKTVNGVMTKKKDELVIDGKDYNIKSVFKLTLNGKTEEFKAFPDEIDFSKSTIYAGKLIYVNAYDFDEVMPIEEINRDRIYAITNAGTATILNIDRYTTISLFENGNITEIEAKDIKAGDIAYIKRDRRDVSIFITQKVVKGKVEEVNTKNNSLKIDEKSYKLETGKNETMLSQGRRYASIKDVSRLGNIKGSDIEVSINLNGNIQLINTDKNISLTNKAIVESVEKDKLHVLTQDGRNETFYVTEYTDLLRGRYDRDDRDYRYNIERIMSQIEKGDIINALVDTRGEIEELEILKGREGIVSDVYNDEITIDGRGEYLSEDFVIFSLSGDKYDIVSIREFEDIFYKNKDAKVDVMAFENHREIEAIVIAGKMSGTKEELLKTVEESNEVLELANKYKDNKKVENALNAVKKTIAEISANIEKMNEKDVEKYKNLLATGLEKLNNEVLIEILAQLSVKIEEVEKTNKLYNKDSFKLVKDYYNTTKSLVKIEDYSKIIKEAEDFLINFEAKVYEDITELEKELNELEKILETELKEATRVLARVVYNDELVDDYKLFLDRLKNETKNMKDIASVKMWQTELTNKKAIFDKDKFDLVGVESNFVAVFMLEERIEVATELLKLATDSRFDEKTILTGELAKATRYAKSLKSITDAEKIKIEKLELEDANLRRALIDLAVKLNIPAVENGEYANIIAKAEAAKISLIGNGQTDKALELNELIFELMAYCNTSKVNKASIDKISLDITSFLDSKEEPQDEIVEDEVEL